MTRRSRLLVAGVTTLFTTAMLTLPIAFGAPDQLLPPTRDEGVVTVVGLILLSLLVGALTYGAVTLGAWGRRRRPPQAPPTRPDGTAA